MEIIILGIILIVCVPMLYSKNKRKTNIKILLKENGMMPSEEFKDDELKMYVCIDRTAKKLLFANLAANETEKIILPNFNVSRIEQSYFKFLIFDDVNKKVVVVSNRLKSKVDAKTPFVKLIENIQVAKYEFLKKSTDTCFYIFDETSKVLTIGNISCGKVEQILIDDIMKVEIVCDNVITKETSIGDAIGKSVIGGAIAGNAGAIIGSVTANSSLNTIPEKIDIKFYVKDVQSPSRLLRVLDSSGYRKSYKKVYADAAKSFAMNVCDTVNSYKTIHDNNQSSTDVITNIEALTKLSELKEKGFLTEEEFEKEKGKLLR